MPYIEAFMRLHNKDAGLKGNRLTVQRKGNLPVKDSRSSEEGAQKDLDIMAAVSVVRVPTAPTALGDVPPSSAEGPGESEPELVSLSGTRQETKLGGGKAPTGAGQYPLRKLPGGVGPEGQTAVYYWAHTPFSRSDLLNQKNSERTRVGPFRMDKGVHQTLESLKLHLASAPAWGLPNLLKSSHLCAHERQGIAPSVLTQMLSGISQPTSYFPCQGN